MSKIAKTILILVFKVLCFVATFSMIVYWCNEYAKDNDLSMVDSKYLNKIDFKYPIFSVCFENPFLEETADRLIVPLILARWTHRCFYIF